MNAAIDIIAAPSRTPDVSTSMHRRVDAGFEATRAALGRLEPLRAVARGLHALGLGDRVAYSRRIREGSAELAVGLILRLDGPDASSTVGVADFEAFAVPGHIKVAWTISVHPDDQEASLVSIALDATGTDAVASERLLDGWPVLGSLAEQQSRRMLAAIAESAEEAEDGSWAGIRAAVPPPLRAAGVRPRRDRAAPKARRRAVRLTAPA